MVRSCSSLAGIAVLVGNLIRSSKIAWMRFPIGTGVNGAENIDIDAVLAQAEARENAVKDGKQNSAHALV